MSGWVQKTTSHTSTTNPRIRLKSSDILNIVDERINYLKKLDHCNEANLVDQISGKIHRFMRQNVPDEESFSSESEMRAVWRSRIDQFTDFLQEDKAVMQLTRESVVDIFMSIAHSLKISELDKTIGELTKQLNEARSIFTPRQALEEIVDGVKFDRANRFSTLLMTNANLQAIFDRKFNGMRWHGQKLNKHTPLGTKTKISRQLFNECYQRSSDLEIHYRPGSAPQFGVVVDSANYKPLQKVFLDVVATYLNKNLVLI